MHTLYSKKNKTKKNKTKQNKQKKKKKKKKNLVTLVHAIKDRSARVSLKSMTVPTPPKSYSGHYKFEFIVSLY